MRAKVIWLNWVSPKVETRRSRIDDLGTFTKEVIRKGEPIIAFGGHVVDLPTWRRLPEELMKRSLVISENLELCPGSPEEVGEGDYINHSCSPNAGLYGQILLIAMKAIGKGEEITFDYAMVMSDPSFRMECHCGAENCRKVITGDDWKMKRLQKAYNGYFSLYLQDKIDTLR